MFTTTKISADLDRVIMLRSGHRRNKPRIKPSEPSERSESVFGTKSYKDALQRAFNKAKEQIFFNPDMKYFVTLTYRGSDHTPEQVLHDVKIFVKSEARRRRRATEGRVVNPKYIYIMEYQKRGSIHVHMIANNFFTLHVNKNGYDSLTHWTHGYSSILSIKDFDGNFRPYLYLFKYMKKSQRIGKSFVHTSRNLNNYTPLETAEIDITKWQTLLTETTKTEINGRKLSFYRSFMEFNDTIPTSTNNHHRKQDITTWHEKVKLHSTKELEKLLKNHSRR